MKKIINNIKGVILAEALISVAMLIIASVAMTTVLTNAVNASNSSKNFLIAENLLIEGIEAVKNIRNSNWLIRPIEKACWLIPDPASLINNPPNCEMHFWNNELQYAGIVPWKNRTAYSIRIHWNHMVRNLSNQNRYHIIAHGKK